VGDTIEIDGKALNAMTVEDLLGLAESLGVVTNVTDINNRESLIRTLMQQQLSS